MSLSGGENHLSISSIDQKILDVEKRPGRVGRVGWVGSLKARKLLYSAENHTLGVISHTNTKVLGRCWCPLDCLPQAGIRCWITANSRTHWKTTPHRYLRSHTTSPVPRCSLGSTLAPLVPSWSYILSSLSFPLK